MKETKMLYKKIELEAVSKASLNTEIRYIVASARIDGLELLELIPLYNEDEGITHKIFTSTLRVLANLKHSGVINFYVTSDKTGDGTTESEFLLNKYSDYITSSDRVSFFVKI